MGVGALIRDFFSSGGEKLANTNRAYYKRSLFLVVACWSLPDPEPWNSLQVENLKKLFGSVQSALHHGTFAPKGSKDVDERFSKANENLEKYLRIYHRGARFGSYMAKDGSPLLTFGENVQEDGWAKKTLDDFSKTINEKVESMKRAPYRTIDITIWGPAPVGVAKGKVSLRIKIQETARIDTVLHRAMEYATMYDANNNRPLRHLMKSLKLDMSPQFYDTSPTYAQRFEKKKKIVSLEPWKTVANLDKTLHIVPNRNSIFVKSVESSIFVSTHSSFVTAEEEFHDTSQPELTYLQRQRSFRTRSSVSSIYSDISNQTVPWSLAPSHLEGPTPRSLDGLGSRPSFGLELEWDDSRSEMSSIRALDLANPSVYSHASSRTLSTDYGLFYTRHALSDGSMSTLRRIRRRNSWDSPINGD